MEDVQIQTQEPEVESMVDTHEAQPDISLQRLIEVYDQIASTDDIAYKTASLLTISNYYSYALRISNEVNGRQGKNRITVNYETSKLMSYSLDSDINDILDKQLTELFIGILNTYLADKQELPIKPKAAQGTLSRVKALMIMLVSTNQYGLIPLLNIPPYILGKVSDLFDNIYTIKQDVLTSWIDWLEKNENGKMAEIVRAAGNEFWGSEGVKANSIYDKYFGELARNNEIKNPIKTYEVYLEFRAEYRKSTKNILPTKLYDIFDISPDAYNRARLNVYQEIQQLFPEDENAKAIQRLIFEQ